MEIFPDRLKIARGVRSQRSVADALGIKQQAYARYETGKISPGLDILVKMCNVLFVSADWLLGLSDDQRGGPPPGVPEPAAGTGKRDCRDCPLMRAAKKMTDGNDAAR